MKIIVGLGNPGKQYENTRHNVGFLVLERLINTDQKLIYTDKISGNPFNNQCKSVHEWKTDKGRECEEAVVKLANGGSVVMAKPQTMMNASGRAVSKLLNFYKVESKELLVVHDDLDLKLGEFKLQLAKGPKVHNGVNSIEEALGTGDFYRLRIGVDNRDPAGRTPGEEYVLQEFSLEEQTQVDKLIRGALLREIMEWVLI